MDISPERLRAILRDPESATRAELDGLEDFDRMLVRRAIVPIVEAMDAELIRRGVYPGDPVELDIVARSEVAELCRELRAGRLSMSQIDPGTLCGMTAEQLEDIDLAVDGGRS